jgi:GT2 family glycosyltransferase
MSVTIVIPFHCNLAQLSQSLVAARRDLPDAEIVVAADGAREDCCELARTSDARVVEVPGPSGPAVARNRAAAVATGDVLVFVDSDVVASPGALAGLCGVLEREPEVAAVFGAYDLAPAETNFMSQYRNLAHAYVHETGRRDAATFWAGLGAMRARVFREVGGFDERFGAPSVEDIDLGYRVTGAGYRIRLAPEFRGRHLKRWTVWSSVRIDIRSRGIPWTQLIHRFGALANDLNTSVALRLSVVASYAFVLALAAAVRWPASAIVAVAALAGLLILNRAYYAWFVRQRGLWFALRVVPAHILHHLCNGISFIAGTALHALQRVGIALPGSLPAGPWRPPAATPGTPSTRPAS